MHDVLYKCSPSQLFCHLHLSMLGVDRCCKVKRYLNATKAKQSALNARKPQVGGREFHSALGTSGSSFDPPGLTPTGIHHFLLSHLTTGSNSIRWLASRVVSVLDSGAEGPGFKSQPRRRRVTVLGKLFTPIVPLFTKQQNW